MGDPTGHLQLRLRLFLGFLGRHRAPLRRCRAGGKRCGSGCGEFRQRYRPAGAAGGFTAGLIASGGDLKAAAIGGLTGAAFGFVAGAKVFGGALSGQSRIRRAVLVEPNLLGIAYIWRVNLPSSDVKSSSLTRPRGRSKIDGTSSRGPSKSCR